MGNLFTADLHLGHARILELCNRPFVDLDQMHEVIVSRWNNQVVPRDKVFILGDLALGKLRESLALVPQLNGKKFLIPGNHDRCWSGHEKVRPVDRSVYEDVGLTILSEEEVTLDGWRMSHMPYEGDSQDSERFAAHRPKRRWPGRREWLLHGHVHTAWTVRFDQINVGMDMWDFTPVHEETITDLMDALS